MSTVASKTGSCSASSTERSIDHLNQSTDSPRSLALCIRDLRKDYRLSSETVKVLKGIHLDVPRGDYIAIMGPSGSGKSTLLNLLGGLDTPTSGQYLIGDCDVAKLSDDELSAIRAERIGFVFQAYNLLPQLNVLENIEVPLAYIRYRVSSYNRERNPSPSGNSLVTAVPPNGVGKSFEGRERAERLANLVGLGDRAGHRPTELSGGQQQRAGIARSLINEPEFILADEATGNLDTATTAEILDLFDNLNEQGTTIIMVTHEEEVAQRARRIVRLRDGVIESDERARHPSNTNCASDPQTDHATLHPNGRTSLHQRLFAHPSQLRLRARDVRIGMKTLMMHPMRSMLTVLGIFIGVASVIWLLAISEGIASKANQQIEELGANNIILMTSRPSGDETQGRRVEFYGLTENDCRNLQTSIPTVDLVIAFCRRNSRELRYLDRMAIGEINACTPEYKDLYSLRITAGRFLHDHDNTTRANVCVLTEELATALFRHQTPIGKSVQIEAAIFRVVGVVGSRAKLEGVKGTSRSQDFADNVYIPLETYWARYGDSTSFGNHGARSISQITLRMRDPKDAVATGKAVDQVLSRTHLFRDYEIGVPLELLEQAQNTRLMFMAMMGLLASISLLVGGIGIMNIMLATVTERTREIGIRRALGARRRDITRQFLIETVLLSVCGGVTGILGGLTCGKMIDTLRWTAEISFPEMMSALPETVQDMQPVIIPWSIPVAFGISVTVGVIFGIYPALRAAAMNPIDALRHVG